MENLTVMFLTAGVVCLLFGIAIMLVVKHTHKKFDGYLEVSDRNTSLIFKVDIRTDPDVLRNKKEIVLRVKKVQDL